MPTVTLSPELVAELDALAAKQGRTRDELAAQAVIRLLEEGNPPAWHDPLVRQGVESLDRGEGIAYSRERILTQADHDQ